MKKPLDNGGMVCPSLPSALPSHCQDSEQRRHKLSVPHTNAVDVEIPEFFVNFPHTSEARDRRVGCKLSSTELNKASRGSLNQCSISTVYPENAQKPRRRKKCTTTIITTTTVTEIFFPKFLHSLPIATIDESRNESESRKTEEPSLPPLNSKSHVTSILCKQHRWYAHGG
ncbi:hypothetical protein, conserved [Trypanosoma brucei gambiense DAL972]|uniref:Uncharacterized protein n=1 Tax=Trypanosoma brucei gambiense (strain MHOM/CI/86/DAL972) TaxID=679716 RepID=C9ZW02_TRYB9|nr:hypothetical protein, conserved [Trypanosoma brucei gambiense DAL972]CBH13590.1 hypothetical protein, conserved [Trypanosoma brucei gambiense DAL972]|eukprot:XP_011775867.1 hypothetical protein, conserved [Trypanosoma brucei gambiense DAL972]